MHYSNSCVLLEISNQIRVPLTFKKKFKLLEHYIHMFKSSIFTSYDARKPCIEFHSYKLHTKILYNKIMSQGSELTSSQCTYCNLHAIIASNLHAKKRSEICFSLIYMHDYTIRSNIAGIECSEIS